MVAITGLPFIVRDFVCVGIDMASVNPYCRTPEYWYNLSIISLSELCQKKHPEKEKESDLPTLHRQSTSSQAQEP